MTWRLFRAYRRAHELIGQTVPFSIPGGDSTRAMLVLGDSTAVGVGAVRPKESVPGLLASLMRATSVENYAVSGTGTKELVRQRAKARLPAYHTILIMTGANDILSFRFPGSAARNLDTALELLPPHERLIVMTAGNVGGAASVPRFFAPIFTRLNRAYHRRFAEVVEAKGGIYVNLYTDPDFDPFILAPAVYLARDGFHPSSTGYAIWFQEVKRALEGK